MGKWNEPIDLGTFNCRNRVIRSATHSFLGSVDGHMTEAEYAMYDQLAASDIGLIITGHCCVSPQGRANEEQINVFDDTCIEDLRQAAAVVQAHDSRFVVQLSHAGPRAIDVDEFCDVVARPLKKHHSARALTAAEIQQIERDFVAAARRVQAAGADGVQLHAAHSYLLSRFLDPFFNQRQDAYGGDVAGRFRIVAEIVQGIRAACGPEFPVLVKINSDTKADNVAYEADLLYMLHECQRLGVTLVELSGVDFINQPHGASLYYLERAARLRREAGIPLSLVGGVRTLADIEKVLAAGLDMVSLGRPLVCEPDLLLRLQHGQPKSNCISCNRCFVIAHLHPGMRCIRQRQLRRAEK